MNKIRFFVLLSVLVVSSCRSAPSNDSSEYLFSYFTGRSEDGLHLAHSTDGLHWEALNGGKSFLMPAAGKDKLMRDPSIVQGPDGTFHMVWTTSWHSKDIGYASTKDLIHWSEQKAVPVMEHEPDAKNSWAPEIFYDDQNNEYLIFWATTIPGRHSEIEMSEKEGEWNHRIYYAKTKDFETFTPTEMFFNPDFSAIDSAILKYGNRYVMFVKNENPVPPEKNIRITIASKAVGPYPTKVSDPITGNYWAEGPTPLQVGEYVYVYFDKYRNHQYGAVRSKNLKEWEDVSDLVSFPSGIRHGTAFPVSSEFVRKLKQNLAMQEKAADKPLFRDPVFDGAADPVVIWNEPAKKWFMYYTNRRATLENADGVDWVHGTAIGIAESDDGASWKYRGTCDVGYGNGEMTYWAPEVIEHDGIYHMYLTVVPGVFKDWGHPRTIVHLTSKDGVAWKTESELELASDKVIDACVAQLPGGTWRMWYNDERRGKSMNYADSTDLYHWTDKGACGGSFRGEGPKVIRWRGSWWMFIDAWRGLGIYRSDDCIGWTRQAANILEQPGAGEDDQVKGGHCDVVVQEDRAFVFYFTHPGRRDGIPDSDVVEKRRSSIQVAELKIENGAITCDRDAPCYIHLKVPTE
ncbi:MAG: family 43 glycosylhydrolase [Pontiellaceae bacterium]|nr:family 43 glycosylhydrolase [Pontiellaceae bacterium]MBN2786499.1 family 43 glycosylhydrolase [Pontiellaceae bacterium]